MPLLLCCNDTSNKDIVIVGWAYNEKDGAWVLSKDDEKNYILDGIDSWDEKIVDKEVKVWGRLLIEKVKKTPQGNSRPPEIPPNPIPQQREDTIKRIILKPKWELIKKL